MVVSLIAQVLLAGPSLAQPVFQFAFTALGIVENEGAATVGVWRSGDLDATVTAAYFTSDGPPPDPDCPDCSWRSAVAGTDYLPQAGILTFAPGETNQTFTISIPDNSRVDGDRYFTVNLLTDIGLWSQVGITVEDNEIAAQVDPSFRELDIRGPVYALALQPDGRILLGGTFDHVADIACTNLARLNPDGSLDASFAAATSLLDSLGNYASQASALALQTDGQILVAGTFTAVNGVPMNGLARLNADGSLDPSFNAFSGVALTHEVTDPYGRPVAAGVSAVLAQPDGKIVIGGTFDTVNGVGRTNLARLSTDGSLDTSFVTSTELTHNVFNVGETWNLVETASRVSALALQLDGKILVGGTFVTVNGADRTSIARLNPDGTLDNTFFVGSGVALWDSPGSVTSIIVQPDGLILIAGQFTSVRGVGRDGLARLWANGGLDTSFDAPADQASRAATVANAANGSSWVARMWCGPTGCSYKLQRLNPDGSLDHSFPPAPGGGGAYAMVVEPSGDVILSHSGNMLTSPGLTRFYANPSEPRVQFMRDPYGGPVDIVVNELSGIATVTIQRLGDTSSALMVDYATSDGTARTGLNYMAASSTLAFAPLEVAQTINIPILDDRVFNNNLAFRVTLSRPSSGSLGSDTLTVVIWDPGSVYTPYTFTTLAGRAVYFGSTDAAGSAARFTWPRGLAVDSAGNIFVADSENYTIRKVTPAGVVTTLAGLAGSPGSADGTGSTARFYQPSGVAVDGFGNLYVADSGAIRRVTPEGFVTTLPAQFNVTINLAVDSVGNVYVADPSTIRKVTPEGMLTTLAGHADSVGSADGTGSNARFHSPSSVAVDSAGIVYVADTENHTIRKVTPTGVVTTLAGQAGSAGSADGTGSAVRFYWPFGVAVDSVGNVYVADFNCTIRQITPTGVVTTLGGLAGSWGSSDGTGSAARFNYPRGVAVDGAGNVYVADTSNCTIRKGCPALSILSYGSGFGFIDGQFGFGLIGPAGRLVVVEASEDLADWLPIWTNTFTSGLQFTDPLSGHPKRFYRVRLP